MSDPNLPTGVTQADVERAEPEVCCHCDETLDASGFWRCCAREQNE